MKINQDRLISTFTKLVSIDSPSFGEGEKCLHLKDRLHDLGIVPYEDRAGDVLHSQCGNLYGFLDGNIPGEPLLFCCHMDTVEPSRGKKAVLSEDGRITSAGNTVLGADDCSGIAAILEAIQTIQEFGFPHRPIELLFTVAEETYCNGAEKLDFSKIRSKECYVLDLTAPIGTAAFKAPTITVFTAVIEGKAAHAGFAPEDGINAIKASSDAISRLQLGRIGEDTTVNIGFIAGGLATNIVPAQCRVKGEIRSYSHENALKQLETIKSTFAASCGAVNAAVQFDTRSGCEAYETPLDHPVVRRFEDICRKQGIRSDLVSTFGGSDNNQLASHGIKGLVLASAMYNCHTCDEYTTVQELCALAELTLSLMTAES